MSDDIVKLCWVGVGAGRGGEHVDPVWLVVVGEIHHRAGARLPRLRSGGGEQQNWGITEGGDPAAVRAELGDVLIVERQYPCSVHSVVILSMDRRRQSVVTQRSATSSAEKRSHCTPNVSEPAPSTSAIVSVTSARTSVTVKVVSKSPRSKPGLFRVSAIFLQIALLKESRRADSNDHCGYDTQVQPSAHALTTIRDAYSVRHNR